MGPLADLLDFNEVLSKMAERAIQAESPDSPPLRIQCIQTLGPAALQVGDLQQHCIEICGGPQAGGR